MESTLHPNNQIWVAGDPGLQNPALVAARISPKANTIFYWISTALFCLEMSFTAYYELLPQGAQAFIRLGFDAGSFRLELSLAKLVGAAVLLIPVLPARLKEWAYAGFAINLVSAVIAHLSISDQPAALAPSMITSVFWGLSYFFWRRLKLNA
ncbi:MAG: DoxX family protein [Terracidiphilus sp.]